MMRIKNKIILICGLLTCKMLTAQVGMNTNSPNKTAVLDMSRETNKGLLIPNVNLTAINSPAPIAKNAPATGLMVYNNNASLPAFNGQPGGLGFYYWDGAKWCRMMVPADVSTADNLGNHTATDILTMSGYNVNNVNKLTTKTLAIAKGTDNVLPIAGNVAMSADNFGNVVWGASPGTIATDNYSFYLTSTGNATSVYMQWKDVPGLSNFNYTAPATGTLVIQAVIYSRVSSDYLLYPPNMTQFYQLAPLGVRIQVYNGATVVDQNCTYLSSKSFGKGTAAVSFPERGVILLQVPVTKGTTYKLTTMCNRNSTDPAFLSVPTPGSNLILSPELQCGTIDLPGGGSVTSSINAFLVTTN